MATLRRMRDDELLQYAQLHKNDPYIFPLTFQESNSRKQMRAEQAAQDTPTTQVVDKNLQEMAAPAPQMAQSMPPQGMPQGMPPQQLPEDVGIGQLPAPNMQRMAAGGIVAFDEGGEVPGYDKGGVTKLTPMQLFEKALDREGVQDPIERAFAKSIYLQESGGGKNTGTSNRGAQGGMQILPDTFKSVADKDMDIRNPFDNMRAGIRYARQGLAAAGGNTDLAGAYYYGGPGGLAKAKQGIGVSDPKNPDAPNTLQYAKQVAARMPVLTGGAAIAAAPADAGLSSLIPGQTAKAPPKAPEGGFLSADSFQRGAESVGLPRDVGRQAYTTLMAPTPLAPASMVPKSGPGFLGGLEKLGEKLYGKFAPGKNMTEAQIAAAKAEMAAAARTGGQEQRLLTGPQAKLPGPTTPVTPAGQGITDLVAPGARMVPVAEDASRLEKMAQASNLEKLRKAQEGVGEGAAATQPAQTAARFTQEAGPASAAERIQAASIARQAEHAAQVGAAASQGQAAKTGLATLAAGSTALGNMGEDFNMGKNLTPLNPEEFGKDVGQMPVEMPAPKEIKEIGKEATPKSERKGMSGEDFLMIGLGILSGQSPNALVNIGEGGLKGLQMVQASRKEASEAAAREKMAERYGIGAEVQLVNAMQDPAFAARYRTLVETKNDPRQLQALAQEMLKTPGQMEMLKKLDPALYSMLRSSVLGGFAPAPISSPGGSAAIRAPIQ
jgi:hypothetical protein